MNINHMLSIIIIIIIHLKREPVKDTFAIRDPKGGLWYKVSCPESLAGLRVSTYRQDHSIWQAGRDKGKFHLSAGSW